MPWSLTLLLGWPRRETASVQSFVYLKLYEATRDYFAQPKELCLNFHTKDCTSCTTCHFCRRVALYLGLGTVHGGGNL